MRAQHASCAGKRSLPGRWRLNLRKAGGPEESAAYFEQVSRFIAGTLGETGVDEWATASLTFASGITARTTPVALHSRSARGGAFRAAANSTESRSA